jgi:GNAT superfamily N-acetyltransferase
MKVRLADQSDCSRMMALGTEMHAESRFQHYPLNNALFEKTVREMVSHPASACVLLAEASDGQLAGMLAAFVTHYFFADVRIVQDKWFYVSPRYRGSAAAMKLMLAVRRWAENRRAQELNINMSVDIDRERFDRFMGHLQFRNCGSNFFLPLQDQVTAQAPLSKTRRKT